MAIALLREAARRKAYDLLLVSSAAWHSAPQAGHSPDGIGSPGATRSKISLMSEQLVYVPVLAAILALVNGAHEITSVRLGGAIRKPFIFAPALISAFALFLSTVTSDDFNKPNTLLASSMGSASITSVSNSEAGSWPRSCMRGGSASRP